MAKISLWGKNIEKIREPKKNAKIQYGVKTGHLLICRSSRSWCQEGKMFGYVLLWPILLGPIST